MSQQPPGSMRRVVTARSPGRLDVMGGIADYMGSLVCELTIKECATVSVTSRRDGQVVARSKQMPPSSMIVLSAAELRKISDPRIVGRLIASSTAQRGANCKWALYVVGCLWWLLRESDTKLNELVCSRNGRASGPTAIGKPQPVPTRTNCRLSGGVTILLNSTVPIGGGVSSSAAIEVSSMLALSELIGIQLAPMRLAAACQCVENRVVGAPCGVMDQVTCAMGRSGELLAIQCEPTDEDPAQIVASFAVPKGYAFVGIHSGVRHEVTGTPYSDARVAAFMGQKILERMHFCAKFNEPLWPATAAVVASCQPPLNCETAAASHSAAERRSLPLNRTGHWLARLDAQRYVREVREHLPDTFLGRDFLKEFGDTNDSVTQVRADTLYNVRKAVDHHVLEAHRVRQFVHLVRLASERAVKCDHESTHAPFDRKQETVERPGLVRLSDPGSSLEGVTIQNAPPTQCMETNGQQEENFGCHDIVAAGQAATAVSKKSDSCSGGSNRMEVKNANSTVEVDMLMQSAGQLMFASHRSYTDCARLGHALTDRLVALVRENGPSNGLLGAKITGGGCGGTVAILIRDTRAAQQAVTELQQRFEAETGRKTFHFTGSSPGAIETGVRDAYYSAL